MVQVLFFGRLKEELQSNQLQLDQAEPCSVAKLMQLIVADNPIWQTQFADADLMVAVDQQIATLDTLVHPQSEVAFFPPVTGG